MTQWERTLTCNEAEESVLVEMARYFIDMGWKKEVLESIKESIQIEAFPEIIFLSKYVGDYNITKVGNKLVFENNGHCVVLKRDEII